jgi:LysR family transcriptional regulator, glycine cleavage system transcriptional activator
VCQAGARHASAVIRGAQIETKLCIDGVEQIAVSSVKRECRRRLVNVHYAYHRNYLGDAADLSIRFGAGNWTGKDAARLLSGAVVPVCSPALLATQGPIDSPEALVNLPLIHDEDRNTWVNWLQQAGVRELTRASGPRFEDGQLTLSAAQSGLGVALLRAPLVRRELESGALVQLFNLELDDGRDYYLCRRAGAELPDRALRLAEWLTRTMRSENIA